MRRMLLFKFLRGKTSVLWYFFKINDVFAFRRRISLKILNCQVNVRNFPTVYTPEYRFDGDSGWSVHLILVQFEI